MAEQDLRLRTKQFALRILKLCDNLPRTKAADVISRQLLRSGTSVAANYRAAQRARSKAEFIAKLGIVEEEVDASCFWLEMLVDAEIVKEALLDDLRSEAEQLTKITVASINTARGGPRKG